MRKIYSPSEINQAARLHLEAGFPRIWVEGEISNLSRPASGHLYFTVKDASAELRCALFRTDASSLAFSPQNGLQVQVRGRLSIYAPRGAYQLIADAMEEAGEGQLRAAFEALKRKLEQEGLFETERKRPLPRFPARIGVITSASGAVIRDILHVTARRWPVARIRLYAVPVQGDAAAPALVSAIRSANRQGWAEALIIGRGGGSLEDLWAFNEEAVARAVADSGIPVISAVGHETDFSITDFVADLRAPTPSAAAELLAPDGPALRTGLIAMRRQLRRIIGQRLQQLAQQHDYLNRRLLLAHPRNRLTEQGRRLGDLRGRLSKILKQQLRERRDNLQSLARTLHVVSPLPTLERGYVLATDTRTGDLVSSVAGLEPGRVLQLQFLDGQADTRVEAIRKRALASDEP